jgi:hypothetical protein
MRHRPIDPYQAGWVSIDDKLADASADELEGPIPAAIRQALRDDVAPDFDPGREREALEAAADTTGQDSEVELVVGAYVVVFRPPGGDVAMFFRRRDPVERLTRSTFTAKLFGDRLTSLDDVFIFDSGFDLVLFRERVLIKSSTAFEALFLSDATRRAGARRAVEVLQGRIRVANAAALDAVIGSDLRFTTRLRAVERRGLLAQLDIAALRRTSARFGIEHRMLRGDELLFIPNWRFKWLAALEDSLVESPGTGRLSIARIRDDWRRRLVTCVSRDAAGDVAGLEGTWGRIDATQAIRRLHSGAETYFSDLAIGRGEWDYVGVAPEARLVLQVADDPEDRSGSVASCS